VEPVESVEAAGSRHAVWMISGLTTGGDMMRGEESELLGLLSAEACDAARDGASVVLPGTHSKQVRVEGDAVTDFRTFMTGELFELLATRSLLGASLEWPPGTLDEPAFRDGLDWAREVGLTRGLFRVRSRSVLDGALPASNTWFLAGLLIGSEVRELMAWDGAGSRPIVLAAAAKFAATYRIALEHAGGAGRVMVVPPDDLLRATLRTHRSVLERLGA
jgi:2-dehydro-3-deoxygalactonokinase